MDRSSFFDFHRECPRRVLPRDPDIANTVVESNFEMESKPFPGSDGAQAENMRLKSDSADVLPSHLYPVVDHPGTPVADPRPDTAVKDLPRPTKIRLGPSLISYRVRQFEIMNIPLSSELAKRLLEEDVALLKRILRPTTRRKKNWTPTPPSTEFIEFVEFLGSYVTSANFKTGGYPPSMLLHATERVEISVVRFILQNGADVNMRSGTERGTTPLQAATQIGNYELMKLLLEAGAEVNRVARGTRSLLQIACDRGSLGRLNFLVAHGADIHKPPISGALILHEAVQSRRLKIAKRLLDLGIDIDQTGRRGRTALYIAVNQNYQDFVSFLLDNKATMSDEIRSVAQRSMIPTLEKYRLVIAFILSYFLSSRTLTESFIF